MFLSTLYCILVQIFIVKASILRRSDMPQMTPTSNCKVCLTERCMLEADYYKNNMDTTVDPCDDFYRFACGNFIKKNANLPSNVSALNPITAVQTEVNKELLEQLNEDIKSNELAAFKKVKIQFRNCMNKTRMEKDGTGPILELLESIGGWPITIGDKWNEKNFDLMARLQKLRQKKYTISFPFILEVTPEIGNTSRSILIIQPPRSEFSYHFFMGSSNLREAYLNYIQRASVFLGAHEEKSHQEAKDIYNFEEQLFMVGISVAELPRHMTVKELSNNVPTIPWLEFFNMILKSSGIQIDENETIAVINLKYLLAIADLIKNTPKRIVANYLGWSILQSTIHHTPENLKQLYVDYVSAKLGTKLSNPRDLVCAEHIKKQFSVGLSSMYIRKYSDEQIKRNVEDLFSYIKDQMRTTLEEVDWMDNQTKQEAIDKLEALRSNIAYPDELLDDKKIEDYYSELEINSGSYFTSALNMTDFLVNKMFKNLRGPSQYNWKSMKSTVEVNGYYVPQFNLVDVTASFLRGSLYQYDRPQYLNFGAIGTIIGHEVIHAFDTLGRLFDKKGNMRDWWQPETAEKYLKKTNCIIDQYNNFRIKEIDMNVNGTITQGENIADNGGIKLSYRAYNEWTVSNQTTEMCLPNFENYTPQQMFWISAASNSCSVRQLAFLKHMMLTDEHSPDEARVIIPFSNTPEFAGDFKCKANSRMNPLNRCSVW